MSGDRNPVSRIDEAPPPPYTETDLYSNPSGHSHTSVDAASHASSATSGDPILTPPASPIACSYFETRPVSSSTSQGPFVVHCITVGPDTFPEHLPSNASLAPRDVTEQDWATFTNYLLPDHASRRNDALINRKLRDEGRSEDGQSTKSGKSHVEAQFERIHSSSVSGAGERLDAAQLRTHAVATVQEWNSGFFNPRGVTIQLNPSPHHPGTRGTMPGAWDSSFEEQPASPQGHDQQAARSGWRRHLDLVQMTDDMIRIGDSFVADVNGLKIGSMVLDGRGIRMDGSQPQPAPGFAGPGPRGFDRGGRHGGFGRGHHFGGRRGGGFGANHLPFGGHRGRSLAEGPSPDAKPRSHSVSSISSISSDSIASSCSLDSLPDHDDVKDAQLPLYADRLEHWVNTPETIRTRQDLADLRAELNLVKQGTLDPRLDRKVLRKQVKLLRGQWRLVRKEQRRVLREGKRERKLRKRAERRERRQRRKEVKRSEREMKREMRDCRREDRRERRDGGGHRHPWPVPYGVPGTPGAPGAPGIPGVPGTHGVPCISSPPAPQAPCGRPGSWGGMFGNRAIFGPQGSFSPQNFAPGPRGPPNPPLYPGNFGPQDTPAPHGPLGSPGGTSSAPPGAWPEDRKVRPDEEATRSGQEAGVTETQGIQQEIKELGAELEKKLTALDKLDEGKERREGWKEIEAIMDKLDGLKMQADEEYARNLADRP